MTTYTMVTSDLPVIDLDLYRTQPQDSEAVLEECRKVSPDPCLSGEHRLTIL